jgi:hypothetical protein
MIPSESYGGANMPGTAVEYKGQRWSVSTEYGERRQRILLHRTAPNTEPTTLELTETGRYDNPALCLHKDTLYVCWEDNQTAHCGIACMAIALSDDASGGNVGSGTTRSTSDGSERGYRPILVSNGKAVFLFYESFSGGRYRLMMRCAPEGEELFGAPLEIGFDAGNDMAPSAWVAQDGILVAWENSFPLSKDDEWINPDGGVIRMPAFGHGWRVNTTLGVRKISLAGNTVKIENLGLSNDWNSRPAIMSDESGGMPVISSSTAGNVYLGCVSRGTDRWNIRISQFNQNRWEDFAEVDAGYRSRKQPALSIQSGMITVADGDRTIGSYELPRETLTAHYTTLRTILCSEISNLPAPIETARETFKYGEKELNLYWGDLHMHSNISKCSLHPKFHCTEVEEKYRFSRDVGGLDYALLTDHETMSDDEWESTIRAAHLNNRDHSFAAFVGFEWTSSQLKDKHNFGHYNVLYKDEGPLLRISDPAFENIEQVWNSSQNHEAITIPHHPGDDTHPLDWNFFSDAREPLVEIFQVRGSYESDDCEMPPVSFGRGNKSGNSVREGLDRGYRFGFTAGGEHEGVGITAVYAEKLTRESIYQALKDRHVYGTTGARIMLDFQIGGYPMGSEVRTHDESVACDVHVKGCDELVYIKLVQPDCETSLYESVGNGQNEIRLKTELELKKDSEWFYIRVKQTDEHMAWSSPIWVDRMAIE